MLNVILKALIVGAIAYILVDLLLPVLFTGLMTVFYFAITIVVTIAAHFITKAVGFPIFDE